MSFSLSDTFFVIVIFQLLFTSVFLFTHQKGKRISNALLGAFFLAICLNLADNLLLIKGVYSNAPSLALWSVWLLLLFGPLLYLYTQSVLYKDFSLSLVRWRHFLPFILLFLVTEIYWQAQTSSEKQAILGNILSRRVAAYQYWDSGLIFGQFFLYMAASIRLIGRFRKVAGEEFSNYRRININWLTYTIFFFTLTMVLAAFNSFIGMTFFAKYWWPVFTLVILLVFIYINSVLLKALQTPELFAVLEERPPGAVAPAPVKAGSFLGPEEGKKILGQLLHHMETVRPWLDPDLTLEQLAGQLGVRPRVLSQVINEGLGQNFFEFINRYRIEEAKLLLMDPADKKITVLEVLYQVGFNSKSSFNTLFKKQTGVTPSEFKRKSMGWRG
jgi:AraC-like DNA-binding protein